MPTTSKRPPSVLVSVLAAVACSFGCSRVDWEYGPPFASAETRGKLNYDNHCAQCHEAENLQLLKPPPKLDQLFHRQSLPSGAPVTEAEIRKVILEGRGTMPSFDQKLDKQQMDDLLKYLHTR
jgi:mono/diheme cytochrome c family protein